MILQRALVAVACPGRGPATASHLTKQPQLAGVPFQKQQRASSLPKATSSETIRLTTEGMRSSPLRLATLSSRISLFTYRLNRLPLCHGYCSSCATKPPASKLKSKATAVTNPPNPPADHRQLGIQQDLFTTSKYSPGSPFFLPNGARVFNRLVAFLRAQYALFGFEEVITPTIYKKSLWEKSGHWDNYAEDMFSVTGRGALGETAGRQISEDEEFGLKPMNCPGHCLLFASRPRSFRELPIRYADFSPLHRNEISGALSGLTRVRRFHQDDGHVFCRPSQVGSEILSTLDFIQLTYRVFNLGPYRLALSTRPKDHYIGTEAEWDMAEESLRKALEASGQEWSVNDGDGAFYGPKIDIILKDSDGKEHQTATIQLDFQLPKRFELEYQAPAPQLEQQGLSTTDPELLKTSGPVRPVMIHRAVLGSVERFLALLIEHYDSRWPFWLSPRQLCILTVTNSPELLDYAKSSLRDIQGPSDLLSADENAPFQLPRGLNHSTFAVSVDDTPKTLDKKISDAWRKRNSIIVVVGEQDREKGTVMANLAGVPDPDGVVKGIIDGFVQREEAEERRRGQLELKPGRLRELMLELERAYV